MEIKFQVGKTYKIRHRKKGEFIGQFLGFATTDPGDPDPYFLSMKVDTRKGTNQAKLAWTKTPFRVINIRPSHILSYEETEANEWLQKQKVTQQPDPMQQYQNDLRATVQTILEETQRTKRQSLFDKLLSRIKK